MDVAVVTAEVAGGAVTSPDVAYAVDQLQRTCAEDDGRVRRARARLFGPDPSGVSFAEATLILTGGLTLGHPAAEPLERHFGRPSPFAGAIAVESPGCSSSHSRTQRRRGDGSRW
jgi:hypothetical protein